MKKIIISMACALITAGVLLMTFFGLPILHENECRERVFEDMAEQLGKVRGAVIGLAVKNGQSGEIGFGGGSGAVFHRSGDRYYAVTAAHAVSSKVDEYRAVTAQTPYDRTDGSGLFETLAEITVEYVSPDSDLAVISFGSAEELELLNVADRGPAEGERLMCMGMRDRLLDVSYGTVTGTETSGREHTDRVTLHDAYIANGSNGGPAVNEQLELCGINIGGEFDKFGHFKYGYLIAAEQINKTIEEYRSAAE